MKASFFIPALTLLAAALLAGCQAVSPSPSPSPSYSLSCLYPTQEGDLTDDEACIDDSGSVPLFSPRVLAMAGYDEQGLAGFYGAGRVFYVKPSGESLEVLMFDNGPDYFEEGLTRGRKNGKVGFYNARFEEVIAPIYDFAWQFENGRAQVGMQCRSLRDGDHIIVTCLDEFTIDKNGNKVTP